MKVLLDECVDWRLLRDLTDHDVKTVKQAGWEKIKNGALLRLAADHFDAFVTVDSNLPHQSSLGSPSTIPTRVRTRTARNAFSGDNQRCRSYRPAGGLRSICLTLMMPEGGGS
jgi:hypothetical protein